MVDSHSTQVTSAPPFIHALEAREIARKASQRAASKLARVHVSQTLEASPVASTTHAHQLKELADEMRMQRASDLWDE